MQQRSWRSLRQLPMSSPTRGWTQMVRSAFLPYGWVEASESRRRRSTEWRPWAAKTSKVRTSLVDHARCSGGMRHGLSPQPSPSAGVAAVGLGDSRRGRSVRYPGRWSVGGQDLGPPGGRRTRHRSRNRSQRLANPQTERTDTSRARAGTRRALRPIRVRARENRRADVGPAGRGPSVCGYANRGRSGRGQLLVECGSAMCGRIRCGAGRVCPGGAEVAGRDASETWKHEDLGTAAVHRSGDVRSRDGCVVSALAVASPEGWQVSVLGSLPVVSGSVVEGVGGGCRC
jgi:hypothetical protein